MREFKYLPLAIIRQYEPEMKKLGISKVARSRIGFLSAYKRVNGDWTLMSNYWRVKRDGFIKRHMAQYRKKPTYRRKLALIAWAYMP